MNAVLQNPGRPDVQAITETALLLFGVGAVGSALLGQLEALCDADLRLIGVADSRRQYSASALSCAQARSVLQDLGTARDNSLLLAALDASGAVHKLIIDATASDDVARRHPYWLAQGYHVISANKALAGGVQSDWQALQASRRTSRTYYGDAATVGAGLPVLSTLRRWRSCGDTLVSLEGVFSGSLSWLFNHFDGRRPFSELLLEAHDAGYCEPDPRLDLAGTDVARKLLILARTSGKELELHQVEVENLLPESLRDLDPEGFFERIHLLDTAMQARLAQAREHGQVLRHLARIDIHGNARVGLFAVDAGHPAATLGGTDNLFVLASRCYSERPVIIQGSGAGAGITAQALLADILALAG